MTLTRDPAQMFKRRSAKQWLAALTLAILSLWLAPSAQPAAAVIPALNTVNVAQWDQAPLKPTIIGEGPIGGFDAASFAPAPFTMATGTAHEFTPRYHLGLGEYLALPKLTLHIWAIIPQPNGTYSATTVMTQTVDSRYEDGWTLHALAEYRFGPDTPGWYAYQYQASTIYHDDTDSTERPVASRIGWFSATKAATGLTLNTPIMMLYGQQVPVSAVTTPPDATDAIKWIAAPGLSFTPSTGNNITLAAARSAEVTTDVNNYGKRQVIAAQAGTASASRTFWLGGLQAYAASYDNIPATGLQLTVPLLNSITFPAGRWRYHWELVDTYREASGNLAANLNNIQSLNNFGDVRNADGETDRLTSTAVTFTISKTGGLVQALMASPSPKAIRLKLEPITGGESLYTNFATLSISRPVGALRLKEVPTAFAWQYSSLERYDRLAKTVPATGRLIVEDTRQAGRWQLSAALTGANFPFDLTLTDFDQPLSATPTVLATGDSRGLSLSQPQATLTPKPPTDAALQYQATITWTLTPNVSSAPLS